MLNTLLKSQSVLGRATRRGAVVVAVSGIMITSFATFGATSYAALLATPVNTVPPSVLGTPRVGATLTASSGTWQATPTFTYQWQRCAGSASTSPCINVPAATDTTYIPVTVDLGASLRVVVTGTDLTGPLVVESVKTSAVTAAASAVPASSAPTTSTGTASAKSSAGLAATGAPLLAIFTAGLTMLTAGAAVIRIARPDLVHALFRRVRRVVLAVRVGDTRLAVAMAQLPLEHEELSVPRHAR